MDRELAKAVLRRWDEGQPVYEGTLVKAASVLNLDPDAALLEARYYTALDSFLADPKGMTGLERTVFSAASGSDLGAFEKVASKYGLNTDDLILKALENRNWVPDLEKLAFLGMQGGPSEGPSMDYEGNAGPNVKGQDQNTQTFSPQQQPSAPTPGAQVQQQPQARVKPTPTAPAQLPPTPEGNLQNLLELASQAQGAEMGGGLPPAGMPPEPPPLPSPDEKIQQVAQDMPAELIQRYAQQLEAMEQQLGFPIMDPKQIQKLVGQLQKNDNKLVDQMIKEVGEEQKQQFSPGTMAKAAHLGQLLARI